MLKYLVVHLHPDLGGLKGMRIQEVQKKQAFSPGCYLFKVEEYFKWLEESLEGG